MNPTAFRSILSLLIVLAIALAIVPLPLAAAPVVAPDVTTLAAGDIAIVGYNADDPDQFAFVLLVNVTAGTQINFTDNGWLASGAFRSGEGTLTWTAPTDLCAGTIIDPGVGSMQFSTSGDQVLAYQGMASSPTFIYALNNEGAGVWQDDATNSNTSALPTGLSNGTTAIALNEIDNAVYGGTVTSGTKAALLSAISNPTNWSGSDSTRQTMPAGPYTVTDAPPCGGDTPPTVASTTPANNATGVAVDAEITVNFSESVDIAAGAFTVQCPVGNGVAFSSAPELPAAGVLSVTLTPDNDLPTATLCTVTVLADKVTDTDGTPQPMAADHVFTFNTVDPDVCNLAYTPTYTIQGSGASTPLAGQSVTTQGVVVGDFELPGGTGQIRGFYLQDLTGDADPTTSDGIFVYTNGVDTVSVGQVVRVSGTAGEFSGQTQLSSATITQCGTSSSVTPQDITLPFPAADYPERYEGMLVRLPQTLYVTEHFQLGRFGQIVLTARPDRLQQPTNVAAPGGPALALQAANNLNRIIIDDDNNLQNPDPIVFGRGGNPLSAANTLRGGDSAAGIVGVLVYDWAGNSASPSAYRLRPVGALNGGVINFSASNPRPGLPTVGGRLRVTAANLLNYFNTFSGCTLGVGGGATDCRGAENSAEFERQWPKTVAKLVGSGAAVIGIMEIENDGYGPASAIQHLVDKLNAATAAGTYAFIDADALTSQVNALGVDAIKVGLIYKPALVSPVGATAALNTTAFVNGGDATARNRPALAQAFEEIATGERFIVAVNHLKSKGSACTIPDAGDGQGNCNVVRTNAANLLTAWLNSNPTGTGDPDILIIGDLNSYAKEDPISAIQNAGYFNLLEKRLGASAYSYVFDGQWGYLDHALATPILEAQVTGVVEWHINADEPAVLDYNTNFKSAGQIASLYADDQFRSSDHDPVIIGLNLEDLTVHNLSTLNVYGLAWHSGEGAWRLGSDWAAGLAVNIGDGVARNPNQTWNEGQGRLRVTVQGPAGQWACLNAWLDYSDGAVTAGLPDLPNGVFDANEHVVVDLPIQPGMNQVVTWPLEEGVINPDATYPMRFRLAPAPDPGAPDCASGRAPQSSASATGGAQGGEVEDYIFDAGPVAVTLASFTAQQQVDRIVVAWETATEMDNTGFNLYRSGDAAGPLTLLAFVPSQGPGSTMGFVYGYEDLDVQPGQTYWYTLEDVDLHGATTQHGPISVDFVGPTVVTLSSIDAGLGHAAGAALPALWVVAGAGLALGLGSRRRRSG